MAEKQIDYATAMRWFIPGEDNTLVPVASCRPATFRAVLFQAVGNHPRQWQIRTEIRDLQLRYPPDRWQALNILLKYGIKLPGEEGTERMDEEDRR